MSANRESVEAARSAQQRSWLAAHPIGRLLLLALPLWKGAHHLRALAIDFGGFSRDPAIAMLLYALALLAVVRL